MSTATVPSRLIPDGYIALRDAANQPHRPAYSTLRKAKAEGRFPTAIKVRGRVYVSEAELDAYDAPVPAAPAAALDPAIAEWAKQMAATAPPLTPIAAAGVVAILTNGGAAG